MMDNEDETPLRDHGFAHTHAVDPDDIEGMKYFIAF